MKLIIATLVSPFVLYVYFKIQFEVVATLFPKMDGYEAGGIVWFSTMICVMVSVAIKYKVFDIS